MSLCDIRINWKLVTLMAGLAYFLFVIIRWHLSKAYRNFSLIDAVVDHSTNKVSLDGLVVACFALVSIWVVVVYVLNEKEVSELLLGILGIFIAGNAAKKITEAVRRK